MKRTIIYKPIHEIETKEEFYTLEERLFDDYDYEIDTIGQEGDYSYGYPIEVEKLEEYINQLKEKGCKFISLDFHEDHGSYFLEGLNIETKTEEELTGKEKKDIIFQIMNKKEELKQIEEDKNKIELEISNLRKQIDSE